MKRVSGVLFNSATIRSFYEGYNRVSDKSKKIVTDTFFTSLHKMAIDNPDVIEVFVDENGDVEFEIDYDFFMDSLTGMGSGGLDD